VNKMPRINSLSLVEIIGIHGTEGKVKGIPYDDRDLLELFPLSIKNKISLLYLESVKKFCRNCDELKKFYVRLKEKQKAILFQIKEIVNTLSGENINYVVFKTLKPFPYIASDIDLLFFADDGSKKALKVFAESGYKLLDSGPRNFTVLNPESGVKIDLYDEITVSRIAYIDKKKMEEYVTETTIDDVQIPVLTPEVDLLSVIAHSFYKEQLYTLADFYAIVLNVTQFTSQQTDTFIRLAKGQCIEYACSLSLGLTQTVYSIVFRNKMREIEEISSEFDLGSLLVTATYRTLGHIEKKMKTPYKYDYATVAIGLIEKILKDENTKRSVPFQVKEFLLSPQFSKGFIERLVSHIVRETY
jgi:hypothetical protein